MKIENIRKRKNVDENQLNNNSGLRPDEQKMLKSSSKRRKTIKKLTLINLFISSIIIRNDGKSYAISARKAGRQRFRQVTRWETPDIDTATDYVRKNP